MNTNHGASIMLSTSFIVLIHGLLCVSAANLPRTTRDEQVLIDAKRILSTAVKQTEDLNDFTCGESTEKRVRKEIRDLTPEELERWQSIMRSLIDQRPESAPYNPPPSFWDLLVAVHIVFRDEAHNGAYFLPWHRLFLFFLENYVRAEIDSRFTLPYWDWSWFDEAADPALSDIWSAKYVGSADADAPIPNGPFAGIRGHYMDEHPVRRGFTSNVSGTMGRFVNRTTLYNIIRHPDWGNFSDAIEMAHDVVHNAIGGDMRLTITSTNDPVFYLHHAFVDSLWTVRQRRFGKTEFGGTHDVIVSGLALREAVSPDFVFQYYGLPVNVTFDQPCVKYAPYRPRKKRLPQRSHPTPAPRLPDFCNVTDMMNFDRCRHGEEVAEIAANNNTASD